ncbi:MAG TPA: hypothetical protein PK510_03805, partial [Ottowia sp.]|nr:hypothetical protein [Ottowia sp.]
RATTAHAASATARGRRLPGLAAFDFSNGDTTGSGRAGASAGLGTGANADGQAAQAHLPGGVCRIDYP